VAAAVAVAAMMAMAGCSTSEEPSSQQSSSQETTKAPEKTEAPQEGEITEASGKAFVKEMRTNVPGAAAYEDDTILNMAQNVCDLGSVDLGVRVLDNYSQIEAEDRAEVAQIALRTACPS
jgi:hypothetical protein